MGIMIFIYLLLLIVSVSFNSSMEDAMWGYSSVHSELTGQAWISLATACAAAVVFSKRETIDRSLSGTNQEEQKQEVTRTIPVCNYYPWECVRFINLVLEKVDSTSFSLVYTLPKSMKLEGYRNGWKKDIITKVDIILKVFRQEYIILDQILNIEWEHSSGTLQKVTLDNMPFSINEIDEVKVIIKTVDMPDGEQRVEHEVYAVSGMNSTELERYRSENGCPDAVCRKEKTNMNWLCTCGFVNNDKDTLCMNCNSRK